MGEQDTAVPELTLSQDTEDPQGSEQPEEEVIFVVDQSEFESDYEVD